MYRLCYYRFDQVQTSARHPKGYDHLRKQEMGKKNIKLKYFEEAFTSEHWMIRIYRVKDLNNRMIKPSNIKK